MDTPPAPARDEQRLALDRREWWKVGALLAAVLFFLGVMPMLFWHHGVAVVERNGQTLQRWEAEYLNGTRSELPANKEWADVGLREWYAHDSVERYFRALLDLRKWEALKSNAEIGAYVRALPVPELEWTTIVGTKRKLPAQGYVQAVEVQAYELREMWKALLLDPQDPSIAVTPVGVGDLKVSRVKTETLAGRQVKVDLAAVTLPAEAAKKLPPIAALASN